MLPQRWKNLDPEFLRLLLIITIFDKIAGTTCTTSEPNLDRNACVNMTAQSGLTAFLHCRVPYEEDCTVSWIRHRDFHILTSGSLIYTNDERFNVFHKEKSNDWILQIKYVEPDDEGTYECQLSTVDGVMSQLVFLKVVVPLTQILGNSEYHIEKSTTLTLVCVLRQVLSPPPALLWYHDNHLLNYDSSRSFTSVVEETAPHVLSRLTVRKARLSDSGNYTCSAPNFASASVMVYVSEGDKMAAIYKLSCSLIFKPTVIIVAVPCFIYILNS